VGAAERLWVFRCPVRQGPVRFRGAAARESAAAKALGWIRQGVDFADGLHLAKAEGCEAFISFDQDFAKAANALGGIKVRAP
jgi:predicted nucleic acid-binding protein